MGLQDILDVSIVCGSGALAANWVIVLAVIGERVSGGKSKVSKSRRHAMDNDAMLAAGMALVGVIVSLIVYLQCRNMGVAGGAASTIAAVVCGAIGVFLPLQYSRTLNRIYYRRAVENLESDQINEALEDASEVFRASESLKSEARYVEAACYCRLGEIDRVERMLIDDGYSREQATPVLQSMAMQYPPMDADEIEAMRQSDRKQVPALEQELEFKHLRSATPRENYRLSGRVSVARLALLSVLGSLASIALGFGYSMALVWSGHAKLNMLIVCIAGGLLGVVAALVNRQGHVRSRVVPHVVTLILAAVTLYAAWSTHYVYHVMAMTGVALEQVPLPTPNVLFEWITRVFERGLRGVEQDAVEGWSLGIIWICEAIGLIGIAGALVHYMRRNLMYCESCNHWMQYDSRSVTLPTYRNDDAIMRIKEGDISAIIKLGIDKEQRDRLSMKLCVCPQCDDSRCLEINETTQKLVDGKSVDVETRIAGPLPITGHEERELRALSIQLMELTAELAAARHSLPQPVSTTG